MLPTMVKPRNIWNFIEIEPVTLYLPAENSRGWGIKKLVNVTKLDYLRAIWRTICDSSMSVSAHKKEIKQVRATFYSFLLMMFCLEFRDKHDKLPPAETRPVSRDKRSCSVWALLSWAACVGMTGKNLMLNPWSMLLSEGREFTEGGVLTVCVSPC